jgi:hypothetical protein
LRTDRKRLWEDAHDLLGQRVGGNVVVSRFAPEQQITYASAGEVRLVAVPAQRAHDLISVLVGSIQHLALINHERKGPYRMV